MFLDYYLYLMMFFFSFFMCCYYYSQVLLTLLSMEFLMLSVLMVLSYVFTINGVLNLLIYYLVFVVCEGVMGLTLLISLIRSNGNDSMNFLNLFLW